MEPTKESVTRKQERLMLRLILGKFRCVSLGAGKARIELGNSVYMEILLPDSRFDLRPGDLCTFYTEVPYKGLANADTDGTSK